MTDYAVGDIQGCLQPLQCLLERVQFDPDKDRLWLVGDLVNRGPHSLATLRFLYSIRQALTVVLGNHDLHLLAVAYHPHLLKRKDTIREVIDAPDSSCLLNWLRGQKLLHYDAQLDYCLVHAGIAPQWTLAEALARAAEVEWVLQDDARVGEFLLSMYGDEPDCWRDDLQGMMRLRVITNYYTRMRFCNAAGVLNFSNKQGPDQAPRGFAPWFTHPGRVLEQHRIIFGHWAALQGRSTHAHAIALDTGCVWGEHMALFNLNEQRYEYCAC